MRTTILLSFLLRTHTTNNATDSCPINKGFIRMGNSAFICCTEPPFAPHIDTADYQSYPIPHNLIRENFSKSQQNALPRNSHEEGLDLTHSVQRNFDSFG